MDISFTVFCLFVCLFVCTVTDFSGEDKASGVKFCTVVVVYWRHGQGIFHFGELCSPRSPKSDQSGTTGKCLGCISLPHRKRHATDELFVEYRAACERR